jgi:Transposase DNA-binding
MLELPFDTLSERLMSRAPLGHRARNRRAARVLDGLLRRPAASLPTMLLDRHQAKRAYAFLSNPMVEPAALLQGAYAETAARAAAARRVLLVGDDTLLDLSSHRATRGLGPVGDGRGRGLCLHGVLALDAERGTPLGLADVAFWARAASPALPDETSAQRRARPRESEVWARGALAAVARLRAGAPDVRLVAVGDRGADVFDFFRDCHAVGCGVLVRAAQDRALEVEHEGVPRRLRAAVEAAPVLGERVVAVAPRPGRAARSARLEVRVAAVRLRPPQGTKGTALAVTAIWAREVGAPPRVEPLDWLLVTDEPASTAAEASARLDEYGQRPTIEDWHMGLKTGCAVEERQFESRHAVENFVALAAIAAVELLRLRSLARAPEPVAAAEALPPARLEVLRALRPRLPRVPTARQALRAVAELGGFMGTGRQEPGWRTLWRGFEVLLLAERGYRLARGSQPDSLTTLPQGFGE